MLGLTRAGGATAPILPMLLAPALAVLLGGCGETEKSTELRPEGPPMVMQVFVRELVTTTDPNGNMITRNVIQLAYGDHPDISQDTDNRQVTAALADTRQKIRVVIDELLVGNTLEEIACADGTWSRVPLGATPDDIADCAGPLEAIRQTCTGEFAVCIGADGPVGVLDENEDGASDDSRLIEGVVSVLCGGVEIPIDRQLSFYQPSGNQQIPAGAGINGLGPAIVIQPTQGLRTGSECTIEIDDSVVDKNDGLPICAPTTNPLESNDCEFGDTSAIRFTTEPLRITGSNPVDGQTNVALTLGTTGNATIVAQFNAPIDAASVVGAVVVEADGVEVTGLPDATVSTDDPTFVNQVIPGGYDPTTTYTVTLVSGDNGINDQFGGVLPEDHTFSFTTRDATPMPDAGVDATPADAGADADTDAAL
jgi:hypothetical protein